MITSRNLKDPRRGCFVFLTQQLCPLLCCQGWLFPFPEEAMAVTDSITNTPLWIWAVLASGALCWWATSRRYYKGLNKYNGPFLASLTNFWRLWQWLWYTDMCYFPRVVKYGKIIRIGPDTLLFNDPEAIKDIYMTHFNKVSNNIGGMVRARRACL